MHPSMEMAKVHDVQTFEAKYWFFLSSRKLQHQHHKPLHVGNIHFDCSMHADLEHNKAYHKAGTALVDQVPFCILDNILLYSIVEDLGKYVANALVQMDEQGDIALHACMTEILFPWKGVDTISRQDHGHFYLQELFLDMESEIAFPNVEVLQVLLKSHLHFAHNQQPFALLNSPENQLLANGQMKDSVTYITKHNVVERVESNGEGPLLLDMTISLRHQSLEMIGSVLSLTQL